MIDERQSDEDRFNRKSIAENIFKLIYSGLDVSPIVIDGDWGVGKTTFCNRLISHIDTHNKSSDKSYKHIYLDAFKADHSDNPVLAIIAEIATLLPKGIHRKRFVKQVAPAMKFLLKSGSKAILSHVLRADPDGLLDEYSEAIKQVGDEAVGHYVEELLTEHVESKANLNALKEAIETVVHDSPLIIIIDELDRCRPDFAIETIELIKHTFDIQDVHFILVANMNQLRASVNHRYGLEKDAERYLDKFIKLRVPLIDKVHTISKIDSSASRIHFFTELEALGEPFRSYSNLTSFGKVFDQFMLVRSLSLREVESLIRTMQIILVMHETTFQQADGSREYTLGSAVGLMSAFIAAFNPSLMNDMILGKTVGSDIAKFFGYSTLNSIKNVDRYDKPYTFIAMSMVLCWRSTSVEFNIHRDAKTKIVGFIESSTLTFADNITEFKEHITHTLRSLTLY